MSGRVSLRSNRIVDNDVGVLHESCCVARLSADNNVFDNAINADDRVGGNAWFVQKTPAPSGNILANPFFGGNAWSDYEGRDCDGDGLGDTLLPYDTTGFGVDFHPLVPVNLDVVPPTSAHALAGTTGKAGWWRSAVTVTLDASDDFCGVKAIWFSVDDAAARVYAGPFVIPSDGTHTLTYWAEDRAGAIEAAHRLVVRIDKTPPTVRITDPLRGTQVPFDALARDRESVLPAAVCAALPFEGPLPLTVLIGTKTLGADAADATSGVERVTFRVEERTIGEDLTAPLPSHGTRRTRRSRGTFSWPSRRTLRATWRRAQRSAPSPCPRTRKR